MPRNKTISELALLAILLDAVAEIGPDGLTFAKASARSGLSAPTLVQRFGDRKAMIEAILLFAWDQLDEATEAADAAFPVSPRGAVDLLLHLTPDPEHGLDGGLPLLREDMRNPALRARGSAWGDRLSAALTRRLGRDPALGRQMASLWQGAIIWWGFDRNGAPQAAIGKALESWCRTAGLDQSP
ncbi:TetR/AcrR family transcriptional regulator [Martelella soudanensis]|uniref:TetR/AcrR family transcriptional regulator n=1 Tax=unclassified Martelella TaxID=2629616 RepID=UPI0015DF8CFA|nr:MULTISPECIES: TetR/AcrR family transcriptional regulator [unclassified Martelella]